jgi:hypothetical protein
MDTQRNTTVADQSQEFRLIFPSDAPIGSRPVDLSASDRRLLLTSTLGLFLRRLRHGYPLRSEEITKLAPYADADDALTPNSVGVSP